MVSPFGRFRRWTLIFPLIGIALSAACAWFGLQLAAGLVMAAAVVLMANFNLRRPTKDDAESSSVWAGFFHFLVTFSAAMAYAAFTYSLRQTSIPVEINSGAPVRDASVFADAMQDLIVASGFFGGLLALFRSTRTNAYSMATLNELQAMREQLRRRDELLDLASQAVVAENAETVLSYISRMVEEAIDPSAMHPDGGALSVWYRGNDEWEIIASRGLSSQTRQSFRQPALSQEEPGAGVVTNMAATNTPQFVEPDISGHPWYKVDPDKSGKTRSIAATLIFDADRRPIGAVCFASDHALQDGAAVRRVLIMWEIAFTLPLTTLSRWAA